MCFSLSLIHTSILLPTVTPLHSNSPLTFDQDQRNVTKMSEITSTTPVPSPAKDTNNEGKTEDKWGAQDTAKLLFIIMQPSNPELAVKGWKGIIEKFQQACGSKYTEHGVKYVLFRRLFINIFSFTPAIMLLCMTNQRIHVIIGNNMRDSAVFTSTSSLALRTRLTTRMPSRAPASLPRRPRPVLLLPLRPLLLMLSLART